MRHKTGSGYRLEYVIDDDGEPLWLKIVAPKYRKRPETQSVTCPDCGMLYVKGLRTDEQAHRSFHRKRFAIIDPKPNRQFADALSRDLDASWVDASSPKWKRKAVYDRALEFKRELGYDFVQWEIDPDHDGEAVGFLFSDDADRIVGACAFRPQPAGRGDHPGGSTGYGCAPMRGAGVCWGASGIAFVRGSVSSTSSRRSRKRCRRFYASEDAPV